MKTFGNILWLIFGGLLAGIFWFVIGALMCLTLVFIPFGLKCFEIGKLAFWPFGKTVSTDFYEKPVANSLWLVFCGGAGFLALNVLVCALFCITIVGIPFGLQYFKIAKLSLFPYAAEVE